MTLMGMYTFSAHLNSLIAEWHLVNLVFLLDLTSFSTKQEN